MVDFDFFEYRYQQRTAATYENYIYQAIEGFELDEIVLPKIEAIKGDKEAMVKLYRNIEKFLHATPTDTNKELPNPKDFF